MFDLCGKVLILVHIQAFMMLDDVPPASQITLPGIQVHGSYGKSLGYAVAS